MHKNNELSPFTKSFVAGATTFIGLNALSLILATSLATLKPETVDKNPTLYGAKAKHAYVLSPTPNYTKRTYDFNMGWTIGALLAALGVAASTYDNPRKIAQQKQR